MLRGQNVSIGLATVVFGRPFCGQRPLICGSVLSFAQWIWFSYVLIKFSIYSITSLGHGAIPGDLIGVHHMNAILRCVQGRSEPPKRRARITHFPRDSQRYGKIISNMSPKSFLPTMMNRTRTNPGGLAVNLPIHRGPRRNGSGRHDLPVERLLKSNACN